jgi:CubicO group peptidase (beta-lactamase class C family)
MKSFTLGILVSLITFISFSQPVYFPPVSGSDWDTISPDTLGWCQVKIDSLYSFLETNNSNAFILLKEGKIVLEKYFGSFVQTDNWYWASSGKTLTAFLVGIAQQEHLLLISDTVSKYLGTGWTNCTPSQEEKITLRHLLTMTSGLDDGVADEYCTLDSCLIYKADAGIRWAYHTGAYSKLDEVLENATGMTVNNYVNQKLKTPTGMTGMFITSGYNNIFYSTARSMARFGLLLLNKGNWNGTQILADSAYFNEMVNSSQNLNNSYGYLTWLNGKSNYMLPGTQFVFSGNLNPHAPADMFAALGKNGQFINIVPSQNLVWVRMGNAPDGSEVPFTLNDEIWEKLNDLFCSSQSIKLTNTTGNVYVYPIPTRSLIYIITDKPAEIITLFNSCGQELKNQKSGSTKTEINLKDISKGLYFLQIRYIDGRTAVKTIIKE